MKPDYKPFLDRMIDRYEGGYGWDRKDPGGPTKYGITCFDLAEHRHQTMTSMSAWAPLVKAMTREEAETIYASKYAFKIDFDHLNDGPDVLLMDYAVNSGFARASRVAATILKQPVTTIVTPNLVAAINRSDPKWFIDQVCDERLHFMHGIRGGSAWDEFGKGWAARVADLRVYAKLLAKPVPGLVITPPDLSTTPTPKATHDDPHLTANVTSTTTTAVAGGGFLSSAHSYELAGVVAGVAVAAGVAYLVYRKYQIKRANETVILPGDSNVQAA